MDGTRIKGVWSYWGELKAWAKEGVHGILSWDPFMSFFHGILSWDPFCFRQLYIIVIFFLAGCTEVTRSMVSFSLPSLPLCFRTLPLDSVVMDSAENLFC